MKDEIRQRCQDVAEYIIAQKATVRAAAAHFGISKSTVHCDCARLQKINGPLHHQVRAVLEENKRERHIRGGLATRRKYLGKEPPSC